MLTLLALKFSTTMLPLVPAWPLPSPIPRKMLPVPALMVVPVAMLSVAAPASRLALLTPWAVISFAVSRTSALLVVILAFTRIERPAFAVSVVPALVILTGLVNGRALFGSRATLLVCALIEAAPLAR